MTEYIINDEENSFKVTTNVPADFLKKIAKKTEHTIVSLRLFMIDEGFIFNYEVVSLQKKPLLTLKTLQ
jgi:hypothetical protein